MDVSSSVLLYAWNVLYWAFVVLMIAAFAMMRGEPAAEHLAYFLRAKTFAYLSGFGADVFLEPLWYVRTLFLLVLLSPVLVRLNRKPLWLIAPAAAVLAYLTIRPDLPCVPVTPRYLIRYTFSPTGLLYFSVGLFLSRRPIRHRFPRCLYVIALFVGAAILLFRLSVVHSDGWNLALLEIANPFVMFGLWGFVPSVALPKFLSGLTFPLFVLHEFSIAFVGRVFKRMAIWEIDDLSGYLVFVAIVVGGTILLALGLKRLFPRAMAVLCGGRR